MRHEHRRFGPGPYELDERGLAPAAFDQVEAVRLTRGFLGAPERFIGAALGD